MVYSEVSIRATQLPQNQHQTSFSSHDMRSGKGRKLQKTPSRMFVQTGHNPKVLREFLFCWCSAKFLFVLGTQDLLYSERKILETKIESQPDNSFHSIPSITTLSANTVQTNAFLKICVLGSLYASLLSLFATQLNYCSLLLEK